MATLTSQNLKHADTVYVRVADEDPLPVLDRLSIDIDPPDSAKVALSIGGLAGFVRAALPVRAYDVDGDTIHTIPGDSLAGSRGRVVVVDER